ncbi:DDE-1 domain-containing protein [Trichonephila clavipes]|nr:DDE-1 domain-containing protein [Trichonephila clavipes]
MILQRGKHHHVIGLPPHTSHRLQPLDVSFFGSLKTYYIQACDNVMSTHPGQTITDKNIGKLLNTTYFKAATVGNIAKGFKECGIEPHNPLVFSEHDFAAVKITYHDVVGDTTEINNANPQTLAVENQHINPPEEPKRMANADSDALKKPVSVFYFKPLPVQQHNVRKKRKRKK